MIKTILFDYAGVITPTQNNYIFACENSKRFGLSPKELMEITYKDWDKAIIGKLDDNIFWNQIANELKIKSNVLMDLIIKTFPIDKKVIDIIKKTKKNYTTVLFSNQIENWLEKVVDDNKLRSLFDYFINSYNIGFKKPDPKIFFEVLRITSSKPSEILFVDDSFKNIETAKQMGINTIQFENFKQFLFQYKKYIDF